MPISWKESYIILISKITNLNDLGRAMSPNFGTWKYVEDVLLSENSLSFSQSTLDHINSWTSGNWMRLNAKKCNELQLCFFKENPILEYCCLVWHHAIPSYLSEQLERVRKRAFGIVFPGQTDSKARRNDLWSRTQKTIYRKGPLSKHLTMTRVSGHGHTMRSPTHRTL